MRDQRQKLGSFAFVAALALVLAVGAQRGRAAVNNVYQPPAGWHRTQFLARGLGVWIHPGDDQSISVQATNFTGSLAEFTHIQLIQIGELPGAKVGAAQQATVCGSHPATYLTYGVVANGKSLIYEQMLAIWAGVAYLATYARTQNQRSLYEARASLTTLCGGLVPGAAPANQSQQPYVRPSAPQTPYLGPSQAPEPLGTAEPTVTPTYGP